jgi:HD superfamily phosphohydrolase
MKGNIKEIRDPIHNFIHVNRDEMSLIDSRPCQRLRHIHQLALTYLVYPGATHKRFEHSLGVMELAGKAFDAITARDNVDESTLRLFPRITDREWLIYWRKVLRLAALAHDFGHAPFSHAAEKELFPTKMDHEGMTRRILESEELREIFSNMVPRVAAGDVIKLALGKQKASDLIFSDWETLLAEIITGETMGVDRMDYLLRDAYHAGVGYGKFDHFRLLETLRIVPPPPVPAQVSEQQSLPLEGVKDEVSQEPMLGLLIGGLHASEALLLARYFMYAQVYFHPVRISYNHHLKTFLKAWLPNASLPTEIDEHLALTDNEVNAAIRLAAVNQESAGHDPARRIVDRDHYKRLHEFPPDQATRNPLLPQQMKAALAEKFGEENFVFHEYQEKKKPQRFSVRLKNGEIGSSLVHSLVLRNYPTLTLDFILVESGIRSQAKEFITSKFAKELR